MEGNRQIYDYLTILGNIKWLVLGKMGNNAYLCRKIDKI